MMKENKWKIIVSSIIILLPALRGSVIPFFLLGMHLLCLFITGRDKKNENQNPKAYGMIFWILPLVSIYTAAINYAIASGMEFGADTLTFLMLGVMFIGMGNYLPKCRQNFTIGIKVPWVYTSEENWNRTHRLGGKVWVIGGIFLTLAVFVPGDMKGIMTIGGILAITFIPMVYSYLFYRKQRAEGEALPPRAVLGRKGVAGGLMAAVIFVIVGFILVTGNIEMTCKEDSLAIEADYWEDLSVKYDSMDRIEYREEGVSGSRTGGWGSLRLLMGTFENEEFGYYTRYTYTGCDSAIVIYRQRGELVLSLETEEGTKALYEELAQKCGK